MLCMDPHTMQPTDPQRNNPSSHQTVGIQTVQVSAIDSTMALGFHCACPAELDELAAQVRVRDVGCLTDCATFDTVSCVRARRCCG
jgi:hypothetical protein